MPISALDYSPAADIPKHYIVKKNYVRKNTVPTAGLMAKYTVSRSRKKTVITALSMSVSVVLFMLIATLCDYIIEYTESNMQFADYIVKLNHTYSMDGGMTESTTEYDADGGIGMDAEYCTAIENSVYTDKVYYIRTAMTHIPTPPNARSDLGYLKNEYKFFDLYPELKKALDGQLDILVVSIPDELFSMIQISSETMLGDGYEFGYAVYDGMKTGGISDGEGNPYDFSYFGNGDFVKLGSNDYRIVKSDYVSPCHRITGWIDSTVYRAVLYLPESAFITEFGSGLTYAMLVNAKDDCYDLLYGELERLNDSFMTAVDGEINERYIEESIESGISALETLSFSAGIKGRMDGLEQMKQTVTSIQTVGYSLAAMIFLIGTLNIVNTALSSAAERKREFAMLEAVGMTDRQLMRMLLTESLYSGIAAVMITVCAGFPLIALIINTAMDALVTLNWQSGIIMLTVCIAVSVISGLAVFRITKSSSVVERIKAD